LKKLDEQYQEKLQEGEIERKKNVGYTGKGYKFVEEEANKVKELRKELAKNYGVLTEDNEEDEIDIMKT
jgi:hypothetical protein